MSKLIRRIIKEAIDEFDWVDTEIDLYSVINNYFRDNHPEYWLEKDGDEIHVWDESGIYFTLGQNEFTIEGVRDEMKYRIGRLAFYFDPSDELYISSYRTYMSYVNLAKVLEPIIGSINFINESEEFDWVDTNTSNLSGQRLYDAITELFKVQNSMYLLEKTNTGIIEILDSAGTYLEYNMEDFTIDRVREDLAVTINDYNIGPSVRMDYSNLARALAPIIGPMEYYPEDTRF